MTSAQSVRAYTVRAVLTLAVVGSSLLSSAEAARPGGGGGGSATCPPNRTAFSPGNATELQAALDCAEAGATITLTAGVVYEGTFTLRHKSAASSAQRISIVSGGLPSPGPRRVSPGDETKLAWLKVPAASTGPLISTELKTLDDGTRRAASHYRLVGLKLFTDHWVNNLVRLGNGTEMSVLELPDDIIFDNTYFAGSSGEGTKQGLVANGTNITVTNSFFKDFKDTANDAQAIVAWNGAGPFVIRNNYLEGSGENVMFGGGDPSIAGLVPTDITIEGNYFFKPLTWVDETSTERGAARRKKWRIKNLFELKNAENVLVNGNVFENNWIQADQQGFAINISPRNQDGGCTWCRVKDVTFTNNLIRNSIAGIKFLATDYSFPSGQLDTFDFSNNLLVNINATAIVGPNPGDRPGRLIQIMNPYPSTYPTIASPTGPINLRVANNTAFSSHEVSWSAWDPVGGVTFQNNVARHNVCGTSNACGISGDGTAPGDPTFRKFFQTPLTVAGNVLFAADPDESSRYSLVGVGQNTFPESVKFKSTCDGTNPIDLATGLPAHTAQLADYTVVTDDCKAAIPKGADWTILRPLIESAVSGQ